MRRYETVFIIDPDLSSEARGPVLSRVTDLVGQYGGFVILADEWGSRKLAYAIKKKERGYYVLFDYCGETTLVDEIERFFRIDDRVLKYMTVLADNAPDIDQLQADIAKAQEEQRQAAEKQAREAETPPQIESNVDETVASEAAADDSLEEDK
jgi:small subunit ribosomal protein S6